MAKELDKVALQVIDGCCTKIQTDLNAALHYINVIEVTDKARELSLVRTKIDEAKMWLRKYNEGIMDKLNDDTDGAGGD